MIAVDEVDVGKPGRAEEHEITGRASAGGVSGGIILAEIGFHFHDAGGQQVSLLAPHQHLAQQVAAHGPRIAGVEITGKRDQRGRVSVLAILIGSPHNSATGYNP